MEQLEIFFHQHNELVALFKTALDHLRHLITTKLSSDAIKRLQETTQERFKSPRFEVASVVVGENSGNQDIVLHRRNDQSMMQ